MSIYNPLPMRVAFAGVTALATAGYLLPYVLVGAYLSGGIRPAARRAALARILATLERLLFRINETKH